jgi:hypothetical protein
MRAASTCQQIPESADRVDLDVRLQPTDQAGNHEPTLRLTENFPILNETDGLIGTSS